MSNHSQPSPETAGKNLELPQLSEFILKSIQDLRFGSVEIIIHDGKVVQIEKKEKTRFS
ncbi:MAG: YezD family protein [bacterium]